MRTNRKLEYIVHQQFHPKKTIKKWVVIQGNVVLFENISPSLVQWWLDNSGLKNVKKRPVYEHK